MIKGDLIFLRALEPSDVEFLFNLENNTEHWIISQTIKPFSKHVLQQFASSVQDISEHKQVRLIICENLNDEPIGAIDIFEYDALNERAGLGILIEDAQNRHKGYGEEALRLCMEYAFDHLLLRSLYCNILEDNQASLKLFGKLGFEKIGLKQDWIKTNAGFKNEWMLQKIKKA